MQHPFNLNLSELNISDLSFEESATEEVVGGTEFKRFPGPMFTMIARPDGTIVCEAETGGIGDFGQSPDKPK
jgi:hypothetical protein